MTIADYPDRRCECGNRLSIADKGGACLECQERPVRAGAPLPSRLICTRCEQPRVKGKTLCERHLREYHRANYLRRKQQAVTA